MKKNVPSKEEKGGKVRRIAIKLVELMCERSLEMARGITIALATRTCLHRISINGGKWISPNVSTAGDMVIQTRYN